MSDGEVGRGRDGAATDAEAPLFVDMDGVLLRTDIGVDAIFALIRAADPRPAGAAMALAGRRASEAAGGAAHRSRRSPAFLPFRIRRIGGPAIARAPRVVASGSFSSWGPLPFRSV
jgi:hypothetical protein